MSNDPKTPQVQIFTPDGQLADIPYDRLHDALAAGAKIGAKVKAPDGSIAFVPGDRVNDALKAGATRVPLDMNDADGGKPGFWSRAVGLKSGATSDQFLDQMGQNNVAAAKFGADTLAGQTLAGPAAKLFNENVLPAVKAVPFIGKAVSAIDAAPGVIGKVVRGATVGGTTGGVEAAVRGKSPEEIAKEAGYGALTGGALGAAIPIAEHFSPPSAEVVAQEQLASDAAAMRTRNLQARVAESKAADAAGQTVPEYRAAQKAAAKAAIPATPEASPIITSQSPDIPSEGRPATWRNLKVSDLASKGGPLSFDAANQAQLRQLDVPNVGLVADPRAMVGGDAIGSSADRLARLREIAGYPSLKGGPGDFASQAAEPKYLYRIRPVGEKGVPAAAANSPAQLTTSLEQAESWAPSKNEEGPHEIVRIPTSSLKPGQTSARPFSPEIDWHKALQAIPESDVEVVRPHQAEVESE